MDKILEQEYVFDSFMADMFVKVWNHEIEEYGFITLSDLLDNQLLLGGLKEVER